MSKWSIFYTTEAEADFARLDGSQRVLVRKMLNRVSDNPLPENEGGYGKPLGNKGGIDLSGLLKIKMKASGLRVVYKLERTETAMIIIVIGLRSDNEVYELAGKRIKAVK